MKYVTEGYEPKDVLQFFEDIAQIPRASGNEAAVAQYIYDWGKGLGLDAYKDEFNNVVLKKPGSAGCENLPPIILQGHTDIVAIKLPESNHDFAKDPLPLYVEDGKLRSRGTTLGADNGNAVAYMMGVLSRNNLVHPPLECIFTSGE
ncbi:MAG: aminoacyl-histidine dipeptidase, partial [Clostridia bacterium]|nr:aminoacyl-histidine dipeptidase [Clostridia bacterium]